MLNKGSAGLGCELGIESPGRDNSDGSLVVSMRVVVDGLEGRSVGRLATHEPFCASVIDLAVDVRVANCLLDIGGVRRRWPRRISACSVQTKRLISTPEAYAAEGQWALSPNPQNPL